MHKIIFLFTSLFILSSCSENQKTNDSSDSTSTEESLATNESKIEIGLKFINSYVDNCNKMGKAMGVVEWITASSLASDDLKAATKKMIDDAIAIDPEMGLDADPVFDAQDFPTEGFVFDSFDEKTNRLIVKGKEWQDFKVTIKLKDKNGIWLVDACGALN